MCNRLDANKDVNSQINVIHVGAFHPCRSPLPVAQVHTLKFLMRFLIYSNNSVACVTRKCIYLIYIRRIEITEEVKPTIDYDVIEKKTRRSFVQLKEKKLILYLMLLSHLQ